MPLFGPPDIEKLKAKRDVQGLIKALSYQNDREIQWRATEALGEVGDACAVEPLIAVLNNSKDKYLRQKTAEALGHLGDARAVAPLIAALKEKDNDKRSSGYMSYGFDIGNEASEALSRIGSPAVAQLISLLKDNDSNLRWRIAIMLGKIGDSRAVEPLCAALTDSNSSVRKEAAEALGKIKDARAAKALIDALTDSSGEVRGIAAKALGNLKAGRAIQALTAALKDKSYDVRSSAAEALAKIGGADAEKAAIATFQGMDGSAVGAALVLAEKGDRRAIPPLITELRAHDYPPSRKVSAALVKFGSPAVEPLIAALQDGKWNVRKAIVAMLAEIGDSRAVPLLINALNTWGEGLAEVSEGLIKIGPPAVPALITALESPKMEVRRAAVSALRKIGDARAVEPLCAVLTDNTGDQDVRIAVAEALSVLSDERAVAPLCAALHAGESRVVRAVEEALEVMWKRGEDPFMAALKDEQPEVRQGAATILVKIGGAGAISHLILALTESRVKMSEEMAETLGASGDSRAVKSLIMALRDKDARVCQAASRALVKLGALAVESLILALQDATPDQRFYVVTALCELYK